MIGNFQEKKKKTYFLQIILLHPEYEYVLCMYSYTVRGCACQLCSCAYQDIKGNTVLYMKKYHKEVLE